MSRQREIAQIVLEILEEPISENSITKIINSQNITDMGMTSLNMVMFIVELENKYDCKIDIAKLCTKDMKSIDGWCKLIDNVIAKK